MEGGQGWRRGGGNKAQQGRWGKFRRGKGEPRWGFSAHSPAPSCSAKVGGKEGGEGVCIMGGLQGAGPFPEGDIFQSPLGLETGGAGGLQAGAVPRPTTFIRRFYPCACPHPLPPPPHKRVPGVPAGHGRHSSGGPVGAPQKALDAAPKATTCTELAPQAGSLQAPPAAGPAPRKHSSEGRKNLVNAV